eukprot:2230573-Amphidinium_carterae.3
MTARGQQQPVEVVGAVLKCDGQSRLRSHEKLTKRSCINLHGATSASAIRSQSGSHSSPERRLSLARQL